MINYSSIKLLMKLLSLLSFLFAIYFMSSQNWDNGTGFDEPEDPNPVPAELWADTKPGVHIAYGSIDKRYEYLSPPSAQGQDSWSGSAWKGERVNIQMKIWSNEKVQGIKFDAGELSNEQGEVIDSDKISIYPVRFVLTDEFLGGCGWRDQDTIPSHLGSDLLEKNQTFYLQKRTLRPVWITVDVPHEAASGEYKGAVNVTYSNGKDVQLPLNLYVYDLLLPEPAEWSFHLDLWQNPFAIARYYEVEPWSEEHWSLLPPYLEMLADAGQKVITTTIVHQPWGGQTYDPFESMIEWIYLGNGEWKYDYSVFDRWVRLANEAGITEQINSYSMVPWGNQVRYFDQGKGEYVTATVKPGSQEYSDIWTPFLVNFRDHLQKTGWLDKTLIAMDERSLEEMKYMVELVEKVTPDLKIALAGSYLEEINDNIYDLCVASKYDLDEEIIQFRVDKGWPTTFYTMCAAPEHPNNFTFSPPAEQAWLGWHAASKGYTGFLRWAYNSWVEDPLKDSRFRTWPAGDTYQIYPGPRSSIRFERLREGIQDFEKIEILKRMAYENQEKERVRSLNSVLDGFEIDKIQNETAKTQLNKGKAIVNEFSKWAEELPK